MDKENELYKSYLSGDDASFEKLVILYKDSLIYFINRFVSNVSLSEELAEDSFVELVIHKHSFNFQNSIKTYLFTIGRNKAFNYLKKQKRHPQYDISDYENSISDNEQLEAKVLQDEKRKMINQALEKLNDDYREALHLIYFEQMSADDAARIMKKSKKQISNIIYRAKLAAEKIFKEEGISYDED